VLAVAQRNQSEAADYFFCERTIIGALLKLPLDLTAPLMACILVNFVPALPKICGLSEFSTTPR